MNELYDWIATNWYEAGTLLLHATILVTLVWFARRFLSLRMASQAHAEAPERVSPAFEEADPFAPAVQESSRRRGPGALRRLSLWFQAPMGG
jgi:hypothetical protein